MTAPAASAGELLRAWRQRRHLSQLELAVGAGTSTRHLSFVETGKAKPGRDVLLRVADHLDLPLRERNELLLAAGHAPAYPRRDLEDAALEPIRAALTRILEAHEPYPAMVLDRGWNVVRANSGFLDMGRWVDDDLLEPPANALRIGLHPRGLARITANLAEIRALFLDRLRRQVAITADADLAALLKEISDYPAPDSEPVATTAAATAEIFTPVRLRPPDGPELSFLGTVATFGFAGEVTSSELTIESLFPADAATREALQAGAPTPFG